MPSIEVIVSVQSTGFWIVAYNEGFYLEKTEFDFWCMQWIDKFWGWNIVESSYYIETFGHKMRLKVCKKKRRATTTAESREYASSNVSKNLLKSIWVTRKKLTAGHGMVPLTN